MSGDPIVFQDPDKAGTARRHLSSMIESENTNVYSLEVNLIIRLASIYSKLGITPVGEVRFEIHQQIIISTKIANFLPEYVHSVLSQNSNAKTIFPKRF